LEAGVASRLLLTGLTQPRTLGPILLARKEWGKKQQFSGNPAELVLLFLPFLSLVKEKGPGLGWKPIKKPRSRSCGAKSL